MRKKIFTPTLVVLLCFCLLSSAAAQQRESSFPYASPPALSAESAVLIDAASRTVLCEKDSQRRMGMASTTKIMTALVAAEQGDLLRTVSIAPEAVGVEGSSVYLYAGERLTLEDLMYAMLLESANDAAAAIAIAVGGSVAGFCDMMNEKVYELGLCDTHFTNPHGLYDDAHYTTAYDLAIITAAALENDTVRKIVSTKKVTVTSESGNSRVLYNHNKLLSRYEGAIGVKTGFTKKTGRCLVSAAERDGLRLIAVTLNAPDDWNDHTRLLDLGFDRFCRVVLINKGEVCHMQSLIGGKDAFVALIAAETVCVTLPRDIDKERLTMVTETYTRYLFAPTRKGDVVGRVLYYLDGRPIAASPIEVAYKVDAAKVRENFFDGIKDIFT